jgi:hypothetical protein
MERPIEKCIFCGSELRQVAKIANNAILRCTSLDCISVDGRSISNITSGTSLTLENIQSTFETVKNTVYGNVPKPKKGPPLTIDDILDLNKWSSKVKRNELSNAQRIKTKA